MDTKSGYVTIIGKPNAGKSTLLNSLLGERLSIISSKPQTTRKNILGIISDETYQIIFLDTPGILEPSYLLQEKMVEFINQAIKDADILLLLFDIENDPNGNEILDYEIMFKNIHKHKAKKIAVINKVDLSNELQVKRLVEKLNNAEIFNEVIPVSAFIGYNVSNLLDRIKELLPKGPKYYPDDQMSDENERFFVSEIIREKIFELYQDEIPFSTEVLIEDFKEREKAKDFISASIIVEKETQKPIIIGKGGEMIKKLGKISRASIENFLDREVYLELRVKVRPKWRNNLNLLKNFGYAIDNE